MTTFLVGSYSDGRPDGLRLVDFDGETGMLSPVRDLPGAPDASWLAFDAQTRNLYVTDEMAARLGAFRLAPDAAAVAPLGYRESGARWPCHIAMSPDRRQVAVANYGAGIVALFDLDAAGGLGAAPQILRGRQADEAGHAHWVQWSPEGDRLYAVDLGHDEVRFWPMSGGRAGDPVTAYAAPPGAGPRHLAFHPDGGWAFLFTEYACTVTALRREPDGTLTEAQVLSSLPDGVTGTTTGAHIQVGADGDTLYVSNRGHNSLTAFRIGPDGRLAVLQTIGCGGDWPRFFVALRRHLIVANQKSGDLVVFDIAADGTLRETGHMLAVPSPVALVEV